MTNADSPAGFNGTRVAKLIAGGGALGIILSLVAHSSPSVLKLSGPAGAAIAFVFGLIYGAMTQATLWADAAGGALTGAGSAFIGILAGFFLRDQPAMVLGAGTAGGAVAGAIGGIIGKLIGSRRAPGGQR